MTVHVPQTIVQNPRDPTTRKWMVRSRAKFNVANKKRKQLYNIDVDPETEPDTQEELMLCHLENEFTQIELGQYHAEVEAYEQTVEEEIQEVDDAHPKN